jgi:hypothetical protein
MNRRQFLVGAVAAGISALRAQDDQTWGGPVLEVHLHLRADPEGVYNHIKGSGETRAVLLGGRDSGGNANHVALDGPEMRRVYDLATDAQVPVTVHFQEIPHFHGEGVFNTGFPRVGSILKAYPLMTMFGHADAFWTNVSAEAPKDVAAYSSGRIKPGALTDRWLGEFSNLYGDMSPNSCNNCLYRDREFMRGFLERRQDKLMLKVS